MLALLYASLLKMFIVGAGMFCSVLDARAVAEPQQSAGVKPSGPRAPSAVAATDTDGKRLAAFQAESAKAEAEGRLAEAAEAQREALAIRKRVQGSKHWQTVDAVWRLKALTALQALPADQQREWQALGKLGREIQQKQESDELADAQAMLQKKLDATMRLLGTGYPQTAECLHDMGLALADQKKDAVPLFRQALARQEKLLGDVHPDIAQGYEDLARALEGAAKREEASDYWKRASEIRRRLDSWLPAKRAPQNKHQVPLQRKS